MSPEVTLLTFACEIGILNFGEFVLQKDFLKWVNIGQWSYIHTNE